MAIEDRYNTFWPRFCATFLDGTALAPLVWFDKFLWNSTSSPILILSWESLYQAITIAYSIGFLFLFGQTPGKMATGVLVLDVSGRKLTLMQAILREIVQIIQFPIAFIIVATNVLNGRLENRGFGDMQSLKVFMVILGFWVILEFVTMLFNSQRRAVHDFIAGTIVVRQPIEERRPEYRKIRGILILLFALNLFVPHLLPETNLQNPRPQHEGMRQSETNP